MKMSKSIKNGNHRRLRPLGPEEKQPQSAQLSHRDMKTTCRGWPLERPAVRLIHTLLPRSFGHSTPLTRVL